MLRASAVETGTIEPALRRLDAWRWIFLPSPTAIEMMAVHLDRLGLRLPADARICLTGPGSRSTFVHRFGDGRIVTPLHPPYDANHLIEVAARADPAGRGQGALVAGRGQASPWVERLRQTMSPVELLRLFEIESTDPPPGASAALADWAERERALVWVAGARSQVDRLAAWIDRLPERSLAAVALAAPLEVPHADIAHHASLLGFSKVGIFDDRTHLASKLQSTAKSNILPTRGSADLATDRPSDPGKTPAAPMPTPGASPVGATSQSSSPSSASAPAPVPKPGAVPVTNAPAAPARVEAGRGEPIKSDSGKGDSGKGDSGKGDSGKAVVGKPAAVPGGAASVGNGKPAAGAAKPAASAAPGPSTAASDDGRRRGGSAMGWIWPVLLLLIMAGLALAGWWYLQQQLQLAGQDNARRVAEAETRAKKLEEQIKSIQDAQGQLVARSGKLESRVSESTEQQQQLTALYDEFAKKRVASIDTTLAEVEQSVVSASQQLQLNGNVKAALLSLGNAQGRLGDSDRAETSIGLRRLIAADIEKLKALPAIDIAGAAGKLDDVIARVDHLTLLSEVGNPPMAAAKPAPAAAGAAASTPPVPATTATPPTSAATATPPGAAATATPPAAAAGEDKRSAFERMYDAARQYGTNGLSAVRDEFGKLVSIRRIDKPDTMLMSPDQRRMARDNLRLQLLNARVNLLNREQALFRKDLDTSIAGIEKWFDASSAPVKQSIATLRGLQSQALTMQYPDLSESLAAIRSAKAAAEKNR